MTNTREDFYYRALYRVAKTINSTLDSRELLTTIATSTAQALGVKACSLMLLSPDRRELFHTAAYGLSERYIRKGPLKVDFSMAEALEGRSLAVLDAGKDPRVQYREQAVQEGIASVLCVPLFLWGEVIGVMRVYSAQPREFSREDTEFVEAVASLGAIALENAQRFEELKRNYAEARQNLLELYATWREERSPDLTGGTIE